jgi:hypothetical protein
MTATHVCSNCGTILVCDNRLMGVGRRNPRKMNPNHYAIRDFMSNNPNTTYTVSILRGELNFHNVKRHGKRDIWWDEDVQNTLSDLVGYNVVNMFPPIKGREWLYKYKVPIPKAPETASGGMGK